MFDNTPLLTKELLEVYRSTDDFKLKIKGIYHFKGDQKGWTSEKHYINIPYNTLYFIQGGDGVIKEVNRQVKLEKGHVYLLPADFSRGFGCTTTIQKYWLTFDMKNKNGNDLFSGINHAIDLGANSKCFETLFHESDMKLTSIWQTKTEILSLLFSQKIITNALQAFNNNENKYQKIFQTIHKELNIKIKLTELAKQQQMTPQGLSRAFHRDMGYTLQSYINKKVNHEACALIIHSSLYIKDIAHQLGFDDEYYFSRFFKKMNHITAQKYRKQFLNKLG